jgi:hypothetical protein
MNIILHGNEIADIRKGGTFDFAVANPPFSVKSWSNGLENDYGRFEFGMPPAKNGDYAFLLHILKSLKSTGKAAVILSHGVLFRGNAEATIRRELLKRGYIKGIIGLPPNLFYGTGIPACILVLDKENAQARTGVFMIDASKGFMKDGPKNRLRSQDMPKIVDVFNRQLEIERYSRMVPLAEIADPKNDYNLNIPRYIESSEPEDIQDLRAHLHGGIPERDIDALGAYWEAFPSLRSTLFKPNRPDSLDLAVDVADVQQTILDRPVPLLDEYDVYERLMTYWRETMHDDVLLINVQSSRIDYNDLQLVHERRVSPSQILRAHGIAICMANGSGALVGKAALYPQPTVNVRHTVGAFLGVFRCDPAAIVAGFAIEIMGSNDFRRWLDLILSGSSINNLRPGNVESFVVSMPALEEQLAIAGMLGDANCEIDLLHQRLDKARAIKQGVMQELLTGRTRLPVQEVVA